MNTKEREELRQERKAKSLAETMRQGGVGGGGEVVIQVVGVEGIVEVLEMVRESGAVNMMDRRGVAKVADMLGYREEADWLRANKGRYMEALRQVGQREEQDEEKV